MPAVRTRTYETCFMCSRAFGLTSKQRRGAAPSLEGMVGRETPNANLKFCGSDFPSRLSRETIQLFLSQYEMSHILSVEAEEL